MNEKVNLPELISLLSEKANITKKDAENFLREFFDLMSDALLSDKQLKIKNLGSFKLTDVSERESVDVRTGERVIIPSHTKVSYTPDNQLSQLINEPFSMFEPMELNDEIKDDNIKKESGKEETAQEESTQEESVQQDIPSDKPEIEEAIVEEIIPEDVKPQEAAPQEVIAEEVIAENTEPERPATEERFLPKISWQNKEPYRPVNNKNSVKIFFKVAGIVLLVALLGVGAYFGNKLFNESEPQLSLPAPKTAFDLAREDSIRKSNPNKSASDSIKAANTAVKDSVPPAKSDTTVSNPTQNNKPATTVPAVKEEVKPIEKSVEKSVEKPAEKPVQKNEVKAVNNPAQTETKTASAPATATKSTNTNAKKRKVSAGERLTVIALEEYGNKIFWVYIYEENKSIIKNPGNVPAGLELVIPSASKYGINKDDPESIKKAAKAASGIK